MDVTDLLKPGTVRLGAKVHSEWRPLLYVQMRVEYADGELILVRERAGIDTDTEIAVRIPQGVSYPGVKLTRGDDGYTRLRVALKPWEGKWMKAIAD